MLIMHVIVGLEIGGAEKMLHRLILNSKDDTHIIVSLTTPGVLGADLLAKGYTVYSLEMNSVSLLKGCIRLWKIIRQLRPNVIQTWMYHSDLLAGVLGRLAGVGNVIWNIRNTDIPQGHISTTGVVIKICAFLSHFIPRSIICCSQAGFKSHAKIGYCRSRMVIIPNGYDVTKWSPPLITKSEIRSYLGLPLDRIIIGIVGRFDPLKGHDFFIRAAGLLAAQNMDKYCFLMVGRNVDNLNIDIKTMIDYHGAGAEFILMGERDDIPSIMYSLDILCLSSISEGFPNVVAEAMLMLVPCVVTDVGDAAQIVGNTGKVVQPKKPKELGAALLEISSMNEHQRSKLGNAARQRILNNYDINFIASLYSKFYNSGSFQ